MPKFFKKHQGKIHFTLKGIRISGCLFVFCIASCNFPSEKDYNLSNKKINAIAAIVQSGDVILRNGRGAVSRAARGFNRKDSAYSHCGIVQIENDSAWVYHALGGSCNPSGQLLRQPLAAFCNAQENDRIAIYRYHINTIQNKKLALLVADYYAKKLPFDLFFNYDSNDKMYCSEFVFKSMNAALGGRLQYIISQQKPPLYVSIDDMYLNKDAQLVQEISLR